MSRPLRIVHVVGSPETREWCDLSELYARGCLEALHDPSVYAFVIAHIAPNGAWRFPAALSAEALAAAPPQTFAEAVATLGRLSCDAALPQMFCPRGMTEMRALLELLAIPYLGNRPLQMALTADKALAKTVVAAAGVDVPRGELLRRGESPTLPPPVVVKPSTADNSEGVSLVTTVDDYPAALAAAFAWSEAALVETFVPLGREVRCGVVERAGERVCLPLEEYRVDARTRPIRRRSDKLKRDASGALLLAAKTTAEAWIVADDDPIVPAVRAAALRAYAALGCRQYGLFDFRIDPHGRPWFLEAGLYCSFSPQSVLVTMMEAAGVPLRRFFAEALETLGASRG